MEFINFESDEENPQNYSLNFSDEEECESEGNSMNHSEEITNDVSSYIRLYHNNVEHYNKFPNQTTDPITAVYEDKEMYFGENETQSELYIPEDSENVNFDNFTGFTKSVKKFYKSLQSFENSDNPFFNTIVYGLIHTVAKKKINLKERDKINYEGLIVEGKIKPDKEKS